MKKILSIIMSLVIITAAFCGCNSDKSNVTSSKKEPTQSSEESTVSSDTEEVDSTASVENTASSSHTRGDKASSVSSTGSSGTASSNSGEKKAALKDKAASFKIGDTLNGANKRITNLSYATKSLKIYDKIELKTDIEGIASSLNVYDEKDVELSISLTSSSGEKIVMPGFYYEEYKFSDEGQILGRTDAKADFRFRITLTEVASWDFVITLKIKGKTVDTVSGYINTEDNKDNHGFLSVEKTRRQNFAFTDGTFYTAIGENIAYAATADATATKRAAKMIEWMKNGAEFGANYTRVWLLQWWLSIQKTSCAPSDLSGGMSDAAQFDKIFDAWNEMDMYGQVCLFSFNQLKNDPNSRESAWSAFPYNSANKNGYLENPEDFFTNEKAIEDTKIYLRYMVARYAYSTNLHSWEFFNEVDLTNGYSLNFENVVEWHKTMCDYLRSIDPYEHMITTSTAGKDDILNTHNMFDFASLHYYNYKNISEFADIQRSFLVLYKKPVMFGECGIMSVGLDEDLVTFHQQNWAGVMGGGAGTGATWYWDTLDSLSGYWDYQVIREMADHIPWSSSSMFTIATDNISPSNDKVEAMGYRGTDFAYIWLYDSGYTQSTKKVTDIKGLTFSVRLNDGEYHVRWIDTWTGLSIRQTKATAEDGVLKITAPTWNRDVAVAITRD